MEYIKENGTKVIIEGDKMQIADGPVRTKIIGTNYANGLVLGGYLSSFNKSFTNELIGIESGIGDIINAKIGDINDAYSLLETKIKNFDNLDIFGLSQAIIETVNEYFNGFNNTDKRNDYYYPSDFDECINNKISNLKGTGAAMCVERAALAQNLLKSLSINSYYKASGIINNNNPEVHSYNLIEYDNNYYIFDTSIPNLINGEISPLIAQIDKETFALITYPLPDNGISISVSHYNPYRNNDADIVYDSNRKKQITVQALDKEHHKHL